MTKNSHKDFRSQFSVSIFLSIIIHLLFFIFIYFSFKEENFDNKDNENFEIIDADIVGLINQSKAEKNQIKENTIVASKSEDLAHDIENEKKEKEEKKAHEINKEIEKIEEKKEDKVIEKKEIKKIEESKKVIEDIKIEDKKEEVIKEVKPEINEEKTEEVKPALKEEIKKEDQIDKKESKKIEDVVKKLEEKEHTLQKAKKELEDLKKSLNKANKVLNNIENPNQNIKNNKTKANNLVGGGEDATAKLGSYIKSRIIACWKIPPMIGVENENVVIHIKIFFDRDGGVLKYDVLNRNFNNQKFFNIILDSAVNAINNCSPVPNLPVEQYEDWKEVVLNFDPSKFM
jgi:TolA protein